MYLREQIIDNLKSMRQDIEVSRKMPFGQACMLYDTCAAIGFTQAETQRILGPAYFVVEESLAIMEQDDEDYFNEKAK